MFRNLDTQGLGVSGRQSEVIELALSFQFKSMTLDMREFAAQVDTYGLPDARRLIDSAKIRIGAFPLPMSWADWEADEASYKQGLGELARIAELAGAMGCTRCLTSVLPACDGRPYHENFEFYRGRIAEICALLEPHGMQLGLALQAGHEQRRGRAFQFIHTFDALVQLAKMAPVDNVGVVLDLWDLHVSGGSLEEIKTLEPSELVAVVLSDIAPGIDSEEADESTRQLPGESGVIDSVAALTMLAEIGYEGPVSLKASPESLAGVSRDDKVQQAADRFKQLWSDAGLNASGKVIASADSV